ncbi:MAG: FecR domain-containing protein [Rhodospirillaceae bacterium]|nr:FecR domain-containing protein [Rhodospirillaceae bacterium]
MNLILRSMALLVIGLVYAAPAAAKVVGKAILTSGDAVITRDDVTRSLLDGDLVENGDLVRSSDNGRLKIVLEDGSVLSLGPNSLLRVSEVHIVNDPPARYVGLDMIVGFLRIFASKSGNRSRFDVTTRHAVTAIRGTEFGLSVDASATKVLVFEGNVLVCRKFFLQNATLVLSAGDQATATKNTLSTKERWTEDTASQFPPLGEIALQVPIRPAEEPEGVGAIANYKFATCRRNDGQFDDLQLRSRDTSGRGSRETSGGGAGEKAPDPIPQ